MVRALAAACLVGSLALAPEASSQTSLNLNTTRFSRTDDYAGFNDIWGYTAPDGREYACVGLTTGYIVVNVSDPIRPYEVAHFPGSFCTWRDLKTYDHYLYVVNDCTAGVDVIDMSDPENPAYVNTFGMNQVQHAHNVAIDTGAGILYAAGTQNGMHVYDLNIDPVDPPRIELWGPSYVHDISVKDGMAHAALIYAGDYRVLNVSDPSNITTMGSEETTAEFTHATWPNADNTLVITADEKPGNRSVALFDVSNPFNPVKTSNYSENALTIPHNPFIKGDYVHLSWYTEGYICLDISDPEDIVKVGRFDTQPNTNPGSGQGDGFNGAWGCYPFADSGFIYISDRQRGLFVLSFNECSIDLPNLSQPQICRVWPDRVPAVDSPRRRVVLTGKGFQNANAVNVGGTVLTTADFTRLDDQTIHFRMPLVANAGFNDITVSSSGGTSLPAQIEVELPEGMVLDTGEDEIAVNSTMILAVGSKPGDFYYPVVGFTEIPSVVPGSVAFDIGNSFADLIFLDPLVANAAGISGMAVVIPPTVLGVTAFWQVAVVDPADGLPADVTPYTSTTFVAD